MLPVGIGHPVIALEPGDPETGQAVLLFFRAAAQQKGKADQREIVRHVNHPGLSLIPFSHLYSATTLRWIPGLSEMPDQWYQPSGDQAHQYGQWQADPH